MPKRKKPPVPAKPKPDDPPPPNKAFAPSALEMYPEHARLLGVMVADYSGIEYGLITLLSMYLETDRDVVYPMLYATASSKARLDVMAVAFRRLLPDGAELDELLAVVAAAERMGKVRNHYAHAHYDWSGDGQTPHIVDVRAIGSGKPTRHSLPLARLVEDVRRMKALDERVWSLVYKRTQLPPPERPEAEVSPPHHTD